MDKTREAFEEYLESSGHGAMVKFAERTGVTTQTLRRFKAGDNVSSENVDAFRVALSELGFLKESSASDEAQSDYNNEQAHWNVIADDLEALSRLLRSGIDGDRKAEKFAYTVSFYNAEIEAGLAKLKQNCK